MTPIEQLIFIVGTTGSTPEVSISDAKVNLLGHLDFTHSTETTSERVQIDNPDSDGMIFFSINGANICAYMLMEHLLKHLMDD